MSQQTSPVVPLLTPKEVSINQIQTELNRIWAEQTAKANGSGPAAVRATTFSLLVYEPAQTQRLLAQLGYYSGPVDGIFGPRMKVALHAAQKDFGLPQTNHATAELLQRLRQKAQQQPVQTSSDPQTLPVFSQDSDGSGIADLIANQNPCRVVSLFPVNDAMDEEGADLRAEVAAYCPVQKQRNSLICCEYITLSGTRRSLENITTLIQSLLMNDLPRFLWWKSDPDQSEEFFQKLARSCNGVIFDSSSFSQTQEGLIKMSQMVEQGLNVADLNWKRLAAWQELTAEAFDPPSRRSALLEVDRVTIDYEAGNPAQALLFLGWLASRLQWHPTAVVQEEGPYNLLTVTFQNPQQRQIQAELAALPVADVGEIAGDLIDLKLASTNLEADCCTVLCSQTTGCMRMEAGGGAQSCRVQQVTPLTDQKSEVLLSQHLQRWSRDVLFEEGLAVSCAILQLIALA
ncbi:glucose-6-phosphate dehydrogenase assembly protein OpcA [Lyngbya confervoides]|uniref:Glucose-6-phosphate dehydrogenase assembly protein OpcA n=1 Tax=Lyngbya confervoides BDU141951 TaxID=1574623 RepID=A0ABD4T6U0_9CYAN|nr:glucose-6-phosphate dehydrogenase assembly protein OpcA [Lyngbya confervoides]MCM1984176.1 glucose-6-phosphate dehydrogenase assembly protein OpcA [Lyngbya confervoides BDU141951]